MRRAGLLLLAACGTDATSPDAGIDAQVVTLPECDLAFDHVYFSTKIAVLPPDQGRDIDGDGDIDNVLGTIGVLVNPQLATAIANGGLISLFVLPALQLPPPPAPVEMPLFWPTPTGDADSPPDPANNANNGAFRVDPSFLDASCQPRVPAIAVQDGLTFTVAPAEGGASPSNFGGLFRLSSAAGAGSFTADGSALEFDFTGAYSPCGLEQVAGPSGMGTGLAVFTAAGLDPDIDFDGDGLEQFVLTGTAITACVDGDGTVFQEVSCACLPEFVDAFSAALHVDAVPARIAGAL